MDPLGKATGSTVPGATGAVYATTGINSADGKLAAAGVTTGATVTTSTVPGTSSALTGGAVASRTGITGQSSFHHSTNVSTAAASAVTATTANERAYV